MKKNLLIVVLFLPLAAYSKTEIGGQWSQGGLLIGKTDPANIVQVFNRSVYVSPRGNFVFGLGRDIETPFRVTVISPEGNREQLTYPIKKREYPVQRVDGVDKKYVAPPEEVLMRIRGETAMIKEARKTFTRHAFFREGFSWPLLGPITGVYGSRRIFNGVPKRPHYGLDIAGPVGAPVIAPADGIVTLNHENMYYSGGTLILDHGQGVSSTFIHLHEVLVNAGEKVVRGQKIAKVGASGRTTGPHLDWRVNWFNQRLDPALLLPPMPEFSVKTSK